MGDAVPLPPRRFGQHPVRRIIAIHDQQIGRAGVGQMADRQVGFISISPAQGGIQGDPVEHVIQHRGEGIGALTLNLGIE